MIIIGIDPGMDGAVVAIQGDTREIITVTDFPTLPAGKGRDYDIPAMAEVLRTSIPANRATVILEQAQPMPTQGVASTFNFGRGFGIWLGILGALEIPYRTVSPNEWTKRIFSGLPGKGKERSVQFARRMFPTIELVPPGCRKPRYGRADAACLAYCGALVV